VARWGHGVTGFSAGLQVAKFRLDACANVTLLVEVDAKLSKVPTVGNQHEKGSAHADVIPQPGDMQGCVGARQASALKASSSRLAMF